jgi:hypothetical protein
MGLRETCSKIMLAIIYRGIQGLPMKLWRTCWRSLGPISDTRASRLQIQCHYSATEVDGPEGERLSSPLLPRRAERYLDIHIGFDRLAIQ